ncbi:MAG: periplasmic heavy metal sensor [Acidobacteriota bacterium]
MRRWWLLIALLLSLGLNLGMLASRALQQREANRNPIVEDSDRTDSRVPRVVYRMADDLRLTGAQRDEFVEIQRTFFDQTIDARGRMAYFQSEVRREITSDSPDREALDEILDGLSLAHSDLERAFVTNLLDTRELLDDEQEKRYRHFLRRMRQVRSQVESRFRERWKKVGERWQRGDPRLRERPPGAGPFRERRLGRRPSGATELFPEPTAPKQESPRERGENEED